MKKQPVQPPRTGDDVQMRGFIVCVLLLGELTMILCLIAGLVGAMPEGWKEATLLLIGGWSTMAISGVGFYVGSSSGSKRANDTIVELTEDIQNAPVTAAPPVKTKAKVKVMPVIRSNTYEGKPIKPTVTQAAEQAEVDINAAFADDINTATAPTNYKQVIGSMTDDD